MFSLPKLIVLAVIILAVLYGYKLFSGEGRDGRKRAVDDRANNRREPRRATREKRDELEVEELVKCPDCGAYFSAGGDHQCRGRG